MVMQTIDYLLTIEVSHVFYKFERRNIIKISILISKCPSPTNILAPFPAHLFLPGPNAEQDLTDIH